MCHRSLHAHYCVCAYMFREASFSPQKENSKSLDFMEQFIKTNYKIQAITRSVFTSRSSRTFPYLSIHTFLWESSIPSCVGHCRGNSKVRAQKPSPSISFPNQKPSSRPDLPRDVAHLSQHHQGAYPANISAFLLVQVLLVALVWDKCS